MLELYINGNLLFLKESTKIKMTLKNPFFGSAGLFSYLVKVDRDKNESFFQYVNALDAAEELPLTFHLKAGDLEAIGDVVVTDSSTRSIEFYLKSGNSSTAAFLKNTYLDETDIYGKTDSSEVTGSLDGCYPDYPFAAMPIKVDEELFNEYDFETNKVKVNWNDKACPAVYLRFILDKLIAHLGYHKVRDDLSLLNDFNRLGLFAPRTEAFYNYRNKVKNFLPHIVFEELQKELLNRFNTALYLSPYLREAEIINMDTIFNLVPIDWTNKFKGFGKVPPIEEKPLLMTHDGEEKDLLSPDEIESRYIGRIIRVDSMSELPATSDSVHFVSDIKRYMKSEKLDPGNALVQGYNLKKSTTDYAGQSFYEILQEALFTYSTTKTNSATIANTDNLIAQFIYPQLSGEITTSFLQEIFCKVDSGESDLIIELFIRNQDESEVLLTRHTESITWIALNNRRYVFRVPIEADLKESNRLGVRLYSRSATAGRTITIEFGGINVNGDGVRECSAAIDYPIDQWREIGICGNYPYGEQTKETAEFKTKAPVLKNDLVAMGGYLCEMPVTDMKPESVQKEFAWVVYRGKRPDELTGTKHAGYANFDLLDLDKISYAGNLQGSYDPDLSLRWTGEKGLVNTLWKKRLLWERYHKRPARLKLDLTSHDLVTTKPYHPIRVDNLVFIIDKIDFQLDVRGLVSNVEADAFTL